MDAGSGAGRALAGEVGVGDAGPLNAQRSQMDPTFPDGPEGRARIQAFSGRAHGRRLWGGARLGGGGGRGGRRPTERATLSDGPHLPGRPGGPSPDPSLERSRPWTQALGRGAPWRGRWAWGTPAH